MWVDERLRRRSMVKAAFTWSFPRMCGIVGLFLKDPSQRWVFKEEADNAAHEWKAPGNGAFTMLRPRAAASTRMK